jgi:hypothetical protein
MTTQSKNQHTRELPIEINETARNEAARDAAAKRERMRVLRDEIEAFAKPKKEELKKLDEEAQKLEHAAATGERIANVECQERFDLRRGEVCVVRIDTEEVVEGPRPMSAKERADANQGKLFDVDVSSGSVTPADDATPPEEPKAGKKVRVRAPKPGSENN